MNFTLWGRCLSFLLLAMSAPLLHAQYYNQTPEFINANSIWTFGHHAGVNFNYDKPLSFYTAMSNLEGSASVADPKTGALLFYTNGAKCYNKNDVIMPNGDSLMGNGSGFNGGGNTVQGACIVPMIDAPGKYYLFSLQGESNFGSAQSGTLFYSIVDMSLNNNLGDIVAGQKNIMISNAQLSESMIAVPGNNCDVWLLVHDLTSPVFKAYHITKEGINKEPIVSTTGQQLQGGVAYALGMMAISPDRSMLAITSVGMFFPPSGVLLSKFNATTGVVSNSLLLADFKPFLGVCFSPDNSKLYVNGAFQSSTGPVHNLMQFNLGIYDSAAIVSSGIPLAPGSGQITGLKLYNERIYYAKKSNDLYYVACIKKPNLSGLACDYDSAAIRLSTGSRFDPMVALPNDVVFAYSSDTTYHLVLDTQFCEGSSLVLKGTPGYPEYIWEDGSTDTSRSIAKEGVYWVLCKDACHSRIDTFILQSDFNRPIIRINILELSTTAVYYTYQWLLDNQPIPGATERTYKVSLNGNYRVLVSDERGCSDTSEIYKVTNAGTSVSSRKAQNLDIWVYPNPSQDRVFIHSPIELSSVLYNIDGRMLRQDPRSKSISLSGLARGMYLLHLLDSEGNMIKVEKISKGL